MELQPSVTLVMNCRAGRSVLNGISSLPGAVKPKLRLHGACYCHPEPQDERKSRRFIQRFQKNSTTLPAQKPCSRMQPKRAFAWGSGQAVKKLVVFLDRERMVLWASITPACLPASIAPIEEPAKKSDNPCCGGGTGNTVFKSRTTSTNQHGQGPRSQTEKTCLTQALAWIKRKDLASAALIHYCTPCCNSLYLPRHLKHRFCCNPLMARIRTLRSSTKAQHLGFRSKGQRYRFSWLRVETLCLVTKMFVKTPTTPQV